MAINTAYVALGSNLNDPERQLHMAIDALSQLPQSRLIVVSSFYQTAPVGFIQQPDFINAVACIETTLAPSELFEYLQNIENAQGRQRHQKNGPRTLDLDLLLYGMEVMNTPDLIIPHPRMHERAFVLVPLLEIAPEIVLPDGQKARTCLLRLNLRTSS